ncbi:MAG: hypothetical protein QNJ47_00665 [Nostocaceae cyanobacterium]|nr:hypothetical protein [Nostocaceae cyanobacterium]
MGAVWVFLNSSRDQLYTQAAWISSNPTENKVYHLPKHISRQIALDVKKEIEASQIVLRYES